MGRRMLFVFVGIVAALLFAAGVASAAEAKGSKPAAEAEAKDKDKAPEINTDPATQTIEDRLRLMQRALERVSADNHMRIPGNTDPLIEHLPNGSKDLLNPETGKPILMNKTMLSQSAMSIREPEKFITFYADAETAGKGRAVIFATGIVKYLSDKDFQKQLAASKTIPLTQDEVVEMREAAQSARESGRYERKQQAAEKARKGQKQ